MSNQNASDIPSITASLDEFFKERSKLMKEYGKVQEKRKLLESQLSTVNSDEECLKQKLESMQSYYLEIYCKITKFGDEISNIPTIPIQEKIKTENKVPIKSSDPTKWVSSKSKPKLSCVEKKAPASNHNKQLEILFGVYDKRNKSFKKLPQDNNKTVMCENKSQCSYGENCKFSHTPSDLQFPTIISTKDEYNYIGVNNICYYNANNECALGLGCNKVHLFFPFTESSQNGFKEMNPHYKMLYTGGCNIDSLLGDWFDIPQKIKEMGKEAWDYGY